MHVGGNLDNGANAGLFYWNLNNGLGNANWNYGGRLIFSTDNFFGRAISPPLGENTSRTKAC